MKKIDYQSTKNSNDEKEKKKRRLMKSIVFPLKIHNALHYKNTTPFSFFFNVYYINTK